VTTPIKLDPKRLLGFRIIARSEGATALHSPKIGVKGCTVVAARDDSPANATRSRPA
jgi:hypothetical protein